MVVASIVARLGPLGPLAFLLVPLALLVEARRWPQLQAIGLGGARPSHALAGLTLGAFLGAHLLVTASRTRYRLQTSGLSACLARSPTTSAPTRARGMAVPGRAPLAPGDVLPSRRGDGRAPRYCSIPPAAVKPVGAVFTRPVGLAACALRAWAVARARYLAALGSPAYRTLAAIAGPSRSSSRWRWRWP
jgi:hypothetical protein